MLEKKFRILSRIKEQEITDQFSLAVQTLTVKYTSEELSSWEQQKNEALLFKLDANAITPLITAIAAARGIELDALVDKIITNVKLFQAEYGILLGTKQKRQDQIKEISSSEVLIDDKIIQLELI